MINLQKITPKDLIQVELVVILTKENICLEYR
jgi:hypothetical protein